MSEPFWGMPGAAEESTGAAPPGGRGEQSPFAQLRDWRRQITNSLLLSTALLGLIVLVTEGFLLGREGRWDLLAVVATAYAVVLVLAFARRIPYRVRALGFLVLFYLVSLFGLTQSGLSGDGRVFLLAFPLLALILLGKTAGATALGISLLTLATVGWAMTSGRLIPAFEACSSEVLPWITGVAVYMLLSAAVLVPSGYLLTNLFVNLSRALEKAQDRWRDVQELSQGLAQQVAERTADLAAVADVARQTASVSDEQGLIEQFVTLVGERYGVYHAGLFLLDAGGKVATLAAASSEGGRRMIESGHEVPADASNPVGQTVVSGEAFLPVDPITASVELPAARWRVILPLRAGNEVLGALDVQCDDEQPLPEERVLALQTLADQLAVGVQNTRLFAQTRSSLEELTSLYRAVTIEAWQRFTDAEPAMSRFRMGDGEIPKQVWRSLFKQARNRGKSVSSCCEEGDAYALAVPVKLRGVPIGVVGFHRPLVNGEWRPDEVALAEGVAERVALALENVRLLEETRRRAARERLIREISDEMQQASNLHELLCVAAEELNQALGGSRTYVRLGTEGELSGEPSVPRATG